METTIEKDALEDLIGHIPTSTTSTRNLECCCGRTDCAFLKYNCLALDGLEKEVHTAATLGQVRHIPRPTHLVEVEITLLLRHLGGLLTMKIYLQIYVGRFGSF
jgi:hypothetical protein